ncbi:MAG: S-layer homology domain-containing protein [Candidatus Saganbacteria bacterium]|nr:S-layer homology domain-containing protein [Candidatus Saganbacteria bacterium]
MRRKTIVVVSLLLSVLAALSFAQDRTATDPLRIGVGARILGLGRAYLGISDDLNGMFINPAALASLSRWEVTSMTGKFINEFDYLNVGTAFPTPLGAFGAGYVDGSIAFDDSSGSHYSFDNRVYLLSWAGRPRQSNWLGNFSFGASFKYFSVDLVAPNLTNANARGKQLDIGLNFQPNSILKFGLVAQNIIDASAGGVLKWDNGTEERLEETLKLGVGIKLLGAKGWRQAGENELTLAIDHDSFPQQGNLPNLWHIGLEWSPVPPIDLRCGLDQDMAAAGSAGQFSVANNFTAGVGLYLGGLRFDYAYHQYSNFFDADTQYFSIGFGLDKEKKKPLVPPPSFAIKPDDLAVLFTSEVTFTGKVLEPRIKRVALKGQELKLAPDNTFRATFPLLPLKNIFVLQGYDRGYGLIDSKRIRLLNLRPVRDVPPDYWAGPAISILLTEKLLFGYPREFFHPERKITRAEMCALLMKPYFLAAGASAEVAPPAFADVLPDYWAAPYIVRAQMLGYLKGYPDGTFRPDSTITRAEGVALIARLINLPLTAEGTAGYRDIPARHYAEASIAQARANRLLDFIVNEYFEPAKDLKRSEAAYILFKAKLAEGALKIKDDIKEFF